MKQEEFEHRMNELQDAQRQRYLGYIRAVVLMVVLGVFIFLFFQGMHYLVENELGTINRG